ncbi:MAG TPA: fumarylacetoacetate hydrolase family protein [Patescibacteria group bacterium]|nr:fumarylacetoacetate hydrolase family protein [Patescibacteria group bacterium]
MRLIAHFDDLDLPVAGVLVGGRVLTLDLLAEQAGLREELALLDPRGLLAEDEDLAETRAALERALASGAAGVPAASLRPAPPLEPGKIVCVGQNYAGHVREQGLPLPTRPMLFAKFANAVVGDRDPVIHPATTHALDLEAELAVVIGRRARRVTPAEALAHVAAYTTANDISARDLQGSPPALREGERGDGQWLRAKGSDTFLPLGPCLVTADELGDPGNLAVRGFHTQAAGPTGGREIQVQDGRTSDMIFPVADLIAFISQSITLEPGDLVITGTPSGVGVFREPPIFLAPGDVVRVEVEGIGSLTNPVVDAEGHAPDGSPAAHLLAERYTGGRAPDRA